MEVVGNWKILRSWILLSDFELLDQTWMQLLGRNLGRFSFYCQENSEHYPIHLSHHCAPILGHLWRRISKPFSFFFASHCKRLELSSDDFINVDTGVSKNSWGNRQYPFKVKFGFKSKVKLVILWYCRVLTCGAEIGTTVWACIELDDDGWFWAVTNAFSFASTLAYSFLYSGVFVSCFDIMTFLRVGTGIILMLWSQSEEQE